MFKAVIFDLNGVFIQSPYLSDRFKNDFGVENEEFIPALKEIMDKVRLPNAGNCYGHWKPYLDKWNIELSEDEFYKYWFEAEKEVPEMIELAKELKGKGVKLFILSNNFVERAKYYKKNFPFLDEIFDRVYYSWQTGFRKPEKEAYLNILKENNLDPEDCFYFDDSQKNIEVAKSLGITGAIFESPKNTKEKLNI